MTQQLNLGGEKGPHTIHTLGVLVRRFRAQIERQQRSDAEWIATFERVSRTPRIRQIIKQICEEKSA